MPASRCTTSIRRKSFIDLNRAGVALMEIVSEPDMRTPGGGRRLSAQAAHHPALPRHLRRQHGGRLHARRRERLGAQAWRAVPHALRGEERELGPLRDAGDRGRGAAAGGGVGSGRRGAAGDAAVRPVRAARRGRCAARRTRTTTVTSPIRTCCRWCWSEAWVDELAAALPELPDAKRARFMSRVWPARLRRRRAGGGAGDGRFLRGRGARGATASSRPTG